jgi:hypothetical protein
MYIPTRFIKQQFKDKIQSFPLIDGKHVTLSTMPKKFRHQRRDDVRGVGRRHQQQDVWKLFTHFQPGTPRYAILGRHEGFHLFPAVVPPIHRHVR